MSSYGTQSPAVLMQIHFLLLLIVGPGTSNPVPHYIMQKEGGFKLLLVDDPEDSADVFNITSGENISDALEKNTVENRLDFGHKFETSGSADAIKTGNEVDNNKNDSGENSKTSDVKVNKEESEASKVRQNSTKTFIENVSSKNKVKNEKERINIIEGTNVAKNDEGNLEKEIEEETEIDEDKDDKENVDVEDAENVKHVEEAEEENDAEDDEDGENAKDVEGIENDENDEDYAGDEEKEDDERKKDDEKKEDDEEKEDYEDKEDYDDKEDDEDEEEVKDEENAEEGEFENVEQSLVRKWFSQFMFACLLENYECLLEPKSNRTINVYLSQEVIEL